MSEQTATVDGLMACPFCGSAAYMATEHDADDIAWYYIRCRKCGARSRGKWHSAGNDCPQLRAEVRDEWNARAALAASTAVQAVPQQPVAWRARGYGQYKTGQPGPWGYKTGAECPKYNNPECCDIEPLYASPVQAVPTQPEQLDQFVAALRAYADNEYCQGIRMAGWHTPCLGWESKIKAGKFGRVEHEAHEKMNKHFGAHFGIHEAIKRALAEVRPAAPAAPTEPVQRPGDHLPGGQAV